MQVYRISRVVLARLRLEIMPEGATGAFTVTTSGRSDAESYPKTGININFNANKSNAIYGNSDTVQPAAIFLIPQIKF